MQTEHHTAAILSIGDELAIGQSLDTNSRWLASRLLDRGIITVEHATVPDDEDAIRSAMLRLVVSAKLVISTGGLGPTADDLTRPALAAAIGDPLVEDAAALAAIRAWYGARGRAMPPGNQVQAQRPRSAEWLPNGHGTAPGLWTRIGGCEVACLPGPPREMRPMFEGSVLPRLRPPAGRVVLTRVIHTFGIAEADLAVRLGDLMDRFRRPVVGTTASGAIVSCRIRYEGAAAPDEARAAVEETERLIRRRAEPYAFGADAQSLPEVVADELRRRAQRLCTVESCTGGLLGAMITDIAGASDVYIGGWVTYSNEHKRALGVPSGLFTPGGPGAVSEECIRAMARAGLARAEPGADWSLAITGIAGPAGARPGKPVGTVWIGLATREGESARLFRFAGDRAAIRDAAAKTALGMLWMRTRGVDAPLLGELGP